MSDHHRSRSHDGELEDHDRGLGFDLQNTRHRCAFLGMVGAVAEIPTETAGPYPGDGSNGPNALTESGIVRRDIRRSFGSSTTKAHGQPFEFKLRLVDTDDLSPLVGYAPSSWSRSTPDRRDSSAPASGRSHAVPQTNRRGTVDTLAG